MTPFDGHENRRTDFGRPALLGTAGNAQIVWEKRVREGPHGVDKFEDKGERTSERG